MRFILLSSLIFLTLTSNRSLANDYLSELTDYAFKDKKTHSLIIQHHGKIILEQYAYGWDAQKPNLLWSMSKSVTNNFIGIAVYEGRLTLEESICDKLTEYKDTDICKITVKDLLGFASGLRWNEVYEDSIVESSPISMLYAKNSKGMLPFVLSDKHDLFKTPGTYSMYSSGDSLILSELLKRAYKENYENMPWNKWADKIGITSLTFERDRSKTFVGSSYAYLTARDTLKWGHFLLSNGITENGKKVLPSWWMKDSTKVSKAYLNDRMIDDPQDIMGYHWWVNRPIPSLKADKAWSHVPADAFAARGHWGQILMVVPSENLVVVRYGNDRDPNPFSINEFMRRVRQFALNKKIPAHSTPTGNPHLVSDDYNPGLSYKGLGPKQLTEISLFGYYKAKEFCSCFYVMKQSEEFCKAYVKNDAVPSWLVPLSHDTKRKIVSVNGKSAQYTGEKYGCQRI